MFDEGAVVAEANQIDFQVKYIFRNLLSRTGYASVNLNDCTLTLSGYNFLKTKDVRIQITRRVQLVAHPTKPLHLLLGCEGGFNVTIVDTETRRADNNSDTSLSELDIKFPSVMLRERFAGRL